MNRVLSYCCLLSFLVSSVALIACRPEWVSDQNKFLSDFVNTQFLGILGTILAITLASVASIHLEINKIEERFGRESFPTTRRNLKANATWLVWLFVVGLLIAAIKPLVGYTPTGQAIANLAAMFIVLWHILILVSLMQLVFAIPPTFTDRSAGDESTKQIHLEPPAPPNSDN